ncbi:MAG: PKD domain-containing protein [Rhodospirillaceae bacterium]
MTRTLKATALLVAIAVAAGAGCTVDKQDAPELSGPSELGTSITLSASPDTLRQDGASQSLITIQAQDGNGQPVRNLPVRLDIAVNGVLADFGQLSGKNLVTGGDGRASVSYTAPLAAADPVDNQTVVQILATPGGTDFGNATSRSVSIRLVPPGIILPPNGTPVPSFTYAPSAPSTRVDVTFDASLSSDSDGRIVSYAWNFGDGSQGSGMVVEHDFRDIGTFVVTLTVTDDRGQSASISKNVAVAATDVPKADFVISPTAPQVGEKVFFNGGTSTAATGRTIVQYDWDFGTGVQASGMLTSNTYTVAGSYTVVLTVTDDAGMKGTTAKTVSIGTGGLKPTFTFSPTAPNNGDFVYFSASGSTSTNPITSYAWNFGDGGTASGVSPSHVFVCTGATSDVTFVVRLTLQDSTGGTASTTSNVTVRACGS